MRLATAYIILSESGFVHRLQWNKEFHCCKEQLEGESIAEELAAESTFMENCYLTWKKKVSAARKEYRELNFFTTQQLMLLRKEIADACHSNDLLVSNLQVLTLLEDVRPNLDTKELKSAIQRAFRDTGLLGKTKGTPDLPSFSQVPSEADFSTTTDQEETKEDDNEAEIGKYLTLAQLGNILRELSVKGKNDKSCINWSALKIIGRLKFTNKYCTLSTKCYRMLVADRSIGLFPESIFYFSHVDLVKKV